MFARSGHKDTMKKLRYYSKCGKILNVAIMGDTCLTCLCGLDKRDIENKEDEKK